MKKLDNLLNNKGGSHILPFFWMHGEDHEILSEEMDKIYQCGIREVCLESRPHPDFCGPKWWSDIDLIMKKAKEYGMRVWVLDDDRFPTGHANGGYKEKPSYAKHYLAERHVDIIGPVKDGAILVSPFYSREDRLLKIYAVKKPDTESLAVSGKEEDIIDLTDRLLDGFVHFDLPRGAYRLFVLYITQKNGGRPDYINLIDSKSVRVLIDEVYEKHYERYESDFGKTFAGFFSDEPELGNVLGYSFKEQLGKRDVKLPWSNELEDLLTKKWGDQLFENLIALWYEMGERTKFVRGVYMDAVTSLVEKCFARQIGEWCEAHKVEYIGHIIEDDNAHTKLGCSIGHYFRAQRGQHMSGIDLVHHQIVPGFTGKIHQWIAGDSDGEFFHYGLAKLGASLAHLDKNKQGRAMCEIFGNYGWAEGVSLMKWLTDHMLVRGINKFVPHAFSPKFPDRDCPPHFYARGNNPQYKHFAELMKYMNRMSELFSDGTPWMDALVLYHAEAEWSGGKTQLFQKPVRNLMQEQLDCDIISTDILWEYGLDDGYEIKNQKLILNGIEYGCLILPYCEYIPEKAALSVIKLAAKGFMVYMLDALPKADTSGQKLPKGFIESVNIVPLYKIAKTIKEQQERGITLSRSFDDLRLYVYLQEDGIVLMAFNESLTTTVKTEILVKDSSLQSVTYYDALKNHSDSYLLENGTFFLSLNPGESQVFLLEKTKAQRIVPKYKKKEIKLSELEVAVATTSSYPDFTEELTIPWKAELPNINGIHGMTDFTGIIRYRTSFTIKNMPKGKVLLSLPSFGDTAQVYINEKNAGVMLRSPGKLDITEFIKQGDNLLSIEITNTLVWSIRDGASTHLQVYPTGLSAWPVFYVEVEK